jgi:hypothetical protein
MSCSSIAATATATARSSCARTGLPARETLTTSRAVSAWRWLFWEPRRPGPGPAERDLGVRAPRHDGADGLEVRLGAAVTQPEPHPGAAAVHRG